MAVETRTEVGNYFVSICPPFSKWKPEFVPQAIEVLKENELYSRMPAFQDRQLRFAYFGGGTPSYISERQLRYLVDGLNRHVSWENAEEVTFECEPGTIQKLSLI